MKCGLGVKCFLIVPSGFAVRFGERRLGSRSGWGGGGFSVRVDAFVTCETENVNCSENVFRPSRAVVSITFAWNPSSVQGTD